MSHNEILQPTIKEIIRDDGITIIGSYVSGNGDYEIPVKLTISENSERLSQQIIKIINSYRMEVNEEHAPVIMFNLTHEIIVAELNKYHSILELAANSGVSEAVAELYLKDPEIALEYCSIDPETTLREWLLQIPIPSEWPEYWYVFDEDGFIKIDVNKFSSTIGIIAFSILRSLFSIERNQKYSYDEWRQLAKLEKYGKAFCYE